MHVCICLSVCTVIYKNMIAYFCQVKSRLLFEYCSNGNRYSARCTRAHHGGPLTSVHGEVQHDLTLVFKGEETLSDRALLVLAAAALGI